MEKEETSSSHSLNPMSLLGGLTFIDDIKEKINKSYLNYKLNDDKIKDILYDYMVFTFNKCSKVNTIIDSNVDVCLKKIYEPILLRQISTELINPKSLMKEKIEIEDFLKYYIDNNLIITDTAGMGKTTFSKCLVLNLLSNDDIKKFPLFIELRKIENNESIIDYIIKEINSVSRNKITKETFEHMVSLNTFLFILDGFDEVNESNKSFLFNYISDYSKNKHNNTIILTTRRQEKLPSLYQKSIYEFEILNKKQITNILLKLDKIYSLKVGSTLIKHTFFDNLDFSLFETPLMVNLLYVYFSYSKDIDSNIVNFYDELFKALYKGHDLTKDDFKRLKKSNLEILSFKKLLSAFSFISLFQNKIYFNSELEIIKIIDKASQISGINISNAEYFLEDLLLNVPLLTKDGNEYKFVHKTIAEYFSADFMCSPEFSSKVFKLIKDNNKELTFKKSFEFLYEMNYNLFMKEIGNDYLDDYISNYAKFKDKPYLAMLKHMIDDFFFMEIDRDEKNEKIKYKNQIFLDNLSGYFPKFNSSSSNGEFTIGYPPMSKYYYYLPKRFIQSITTKYHSQNDNLINFKKFKIYNSSSPEIINSLEKRDFRIFVFSIINEMTLDIDLDMIIDIEKVKLLKKREVEQEDVFLDF